MEKKENTGRKYDYYKQDIGDLIEYFSGLDDEKKHLLLNWFGACADYTTAVVEHVVYSHNFVGNSSPSARAEMEELNKKRTRKHNDAIKMTIQLNNILKKASGNAAYFFKLNNINIDDVKQVYDLSSDQRFDLGQLYFQTSSLIASLDDDEVKELGLEDLRNSVDRKVDRYGVKLGKDKESKNVKTADDIYDDISR